MLIQAAAKATDQIRASEQKLADEFRKLGKTVVEVDRAAFRAAALPRCRCTTMAAEAGARPSTTRCRR